MNYLIPAFVVWGLMTAGLLQVIGCLILYHELDQARHGMVWAIAFSAAFFAMGVATIALIVWFSYKELWT